MCAARRLHDLAADHHELHALERLHVVERIAGDGDEVRELAALDGSEAVVPAQELRADARAGLDRLHRREAGLDEDGHLAHEHDRVGHVSAEIHADGDLHALLVGAADGGEELAALVGGVVVLLVLGAQLVAFRVVVADVDGRHEERALGRHHLRCLRRR